VKPTAGLVLDAGAVSLAGGSVTGAVTASAGTTISGAGTITGAVSNNGLVDAAGGALTITGAVTGSGRLQIENGASLSLSGNAPETIDFVTATTVKEKLTLLTPGGSFGTINGFAIGDTIDLRGAAATTDNFANGILTVMNGTATVATLTVAGSFSGEHFGLSTDGKGGTDITLRIGAAAMPATTLPKASAANSRQLSQLVEAVAGQSATLSVAGEISALHRLQDGAFGLIAGNGR
jgi:hypothetical protein